MGLAQAELIAIRWVVAKAITMSSSFWTWNIHTLFKTIGINIEYINRCLRSVCIYIVHAYFLEDIDVLWSAEFQRITFTIPSSCTVWHFYYPTNIGTTLSFKGINTWYDNILRYTLHWHTISVSFAVLRKCLYIQSGEMSRQSFRKTSWEWNRL